MLAFVILREILESRALLLGFLSARDWVVSYQQSLIVMRCLGHQQVEKSILN